MGNNTTVLVLNDYLGDIEKDPQLGKMLSLAIKMHKNGEKNSASSGVIVAESHHADDFAILAVGGNTVETLAYLPVGALSGRTALGILGEVARDWAEKEGLVIMSKKDYQEGLKLSSYTRHEMNEYAKKKFGYRLIECRRGKKQKKPVKVVRKKVTG